MDPSANHHSRQHPVIDTLEQTRLDQHEGPFPHPHVVQSATTSAHPLEHVGADVTDQILQQAEVVPLAPGSHSTHAGKKSDATQDHADRRGGASAPLKPMSPGKAQTSNPSAQSTKDHYPPESPSTSSSTFSTPMQQPQQQQQQQHMDTPARRLSTTATLPSATWQPLASKSSNQLPSKTIVDTAYSNNNAATSAAMMHESEHDRPSVLPEIVPGFRGRFADIHHATLNSVKGATGGAAGSTDNLSTGGNGHDNGVRQRDQYQQQQQQHQTSENKVQGSQWTGGTMFPTMPGFNPFGYNNNNSSNKAPTSSHQRRLSAAEEAHRKLSKSSILYESSDLAESTTQLTDDDSVGPSLAGAGASSVPPSKTMVQGGQGGRRWSHELSPEKAGLVGSMMEAAGLIKDVVMDKIESSDIHLRRNNHHTLSPEERQEAARVAFGGSEETGDQTIYLEKLQDHLRRETADKARAAAAGGGSPTATTATTTTADILGSAPHAGEEHHKSIFHLAANPEVKKSLLLDHPESLGYHARDPTLAPFEESTLAAQHRMAANSSPQDVSKTRR
ncbi:hypothetical protein KVV02_003714 [Mortierella alpina]|uniref:Uncharacterized protein n=1 Tax=Mortierella alpina TaxID=64518 RepID=A0A9P8CZ77_MORAP|nr:hypothetical protein KVV02_003714 [Mortierella alpina]